MPKVLIQSVHAFYDPFLFDSVLKICMIGFKYGQGQRFALQLDLKHTFYAPSVSHLSSEWD